jgi:DNA replication protein DnaC
MIDLKVQRLLNDIGSVSGKKEVTCDKHGVFESVERRMLGKRLIWSACPACNVLFKDARQDRIVKDEALSRIKAIGIPLRYQDCRLSNYVPVNDIQSTALDICKRVLSLRDIEKSSRNLDKCFIFTGDVGVGKTHLLSALAIEMDQPDLRARYTTALRMIKMIRASYSRTVSDEDIERHLIKPDVLMIDEVGVQFGTDSERIAFYDIINQRYENLKMTIIASNLNNDGLDVLLGSRIMRRFTDNGVTISLGDER